MMFIIVDIIWFIFMLVWEMYSYIYYKENCECEGFDVIRGLESGKKLMFWEKFLYKLIIWK